MKDDETSRFGTMKGVDKVLKHLSLDFAAMATVDELTRLLQGLLLRSYLKSKVAT